VIEIIRPGAQASVQDLGRVGFRRFGVGRSGAADDLALRVGNRLLGNDPARRRSSSHWAAPPCVSRPTCAWR
jgi:allophanate hydrolase subunit 2